MIVATEAMTRPIDLCKQIVPNAELILDCGAGEGFFAGEARKEWPGARIMSFEPCPHFHRALRSKKETIGTVLQPFALSDYCGRGTLTLTKHPKSNSLLGYLEDSLLKEEHRPVSYAEVEVTTLDQWAKQNGYDGDRIDLLKMDLQGSELAALRGATELLKRTECILIEVWHQQCYKNAPTDLEIDAFLCGNGFARVGMGEHPTGIWGDWIYRRKLRKGVSRLDLQSNASLTGNAFQESNPMPIRLNLGAGSTVIDGFTAIDRKFGTEAYPLAYADNSVDEIRASHILEHFSFGDALKAVKDWTRALKPGGVIRIAVPDVQKILASKDTEDNWRFHLFGGQTDSDNFHKSGFDEGLLHRYMLEAGLTDIQRWESHNTDTAAHKVSLRLQGSKPLAATVAHDATDTIKIAGVMSLPRVGWNDTWGCIQEALAPFKIPVRRFNGVFWGQCMQRAFQECVAEGLDWILTLDYDSIFGAKHVDRLLHWFGQRPDIDALAALQCRRGTPFPLMTTGSKSCETNGQPIKVATAHFGLTLIRVDALKDLAKPWFYARPDAAGEWGDDRLDDDIWFWHQWRLAGKNLYVAPDVSIGHLEVMVAEFDENLQPRHTYVPAWRDANCEAKSKQ